MIAQYCTLILNFNAIYTISPTCNIESIRLSLLFFFLYIDSVCCILCQAYKHVASCFLELNTETAFRLYLILYILG